MDRVAKREGVSAENANIFLGDDGRWNASIGGRAKKFGFKRGKGGYLDFGRAVRNDLKRVNFEAEASYKVDFGIIKQKDTGIAGYTIKGPAVTILEMKANTKKGSGIYHLGENNIYKGSVWGGSYEGPADIKGGTNWVLSNGEMNYKNNIGVGVPFLEAKYETKNMFENHKMSVGLQEDASFSIPVGGIFSMGIKVNLRAQAYIEN